MKCKIKEACESQCPPNKQKAKATKLSNVRNNICNTLRKSHAGTSLSARFSLLFSRASTSKQRQLFGEALAWSKSCVFTSVCSSSNRFGGQDSLRASLASLQETAGGVTWKDMSAFKKPFVSPVPPRVRAKWWMWSRLIEKTKERRQCLCLRCLEGL